MTTEPDSTVPTIECVHGALFKPVAAPGGGTEVRLLIGKRASTSKYYPGLWELPGGQVEDTDVKTHMSSSLYSYILPCLQRELLEELSLTITDGITGSGCVGASAPGTGVTSTGASSTTPIPAATSPSSSTYTSSFTLSSLSSYPPTRSGHYVSFLLSTHNVFFSSPDQHPSPLQLHSHLLHVRLSPSDTPILNLEVHDCLEWIGRDQLMEMLCDHNAPVTHLFRVYAARLVIDDQVWK